MEDSDGQVISVLEKLLDIKQPARSCWEKYWCCWYKSKTLSLLFLLFFIYRNFEKNCYYNNNKFY